MMASNGNTPIYKCDDREPDGTPHDAGAFFPVFAGEINSDFPTASF
jgi:hypothetical protein